MAKELSVEYIQMARHSLSHIMAKAVCQLFDDVKLGFGPAIDNGFYYDFDLTHILKEEDFSKIEQKMLEIIRNDDDFVQIPLDAEVFSNQPYKLELINELAQNGEIATSYKTGEDFIDLCAGPHVESVKELRNWGFSIASVAGAYWRGDSNKPMLQRLYCHAFPSQKELKAYKKFLEEAKKRDHRILGPKFDLFFFDETAPAMPYWLPKGWKLYRTLLEFSQKVHEERGYFEIVGPQLNHKSLWETSGHWEHYQDNMYVVNSDDEQVYGLKPMNCPNAMIVFSKKNRSYRDLPLRFMETSLLHRKEASGTFHGLLRVQTFRQDDSHNFISFSQIYDEINDIIDLTDYLYSILGLSYRPILSTRPAEFMGKIEDWDSAEAELKKVLDKRYKEYDINEGDGAFYGPKIDIMVRDSLGREWQCCTIQLDFQLAGNFNLKYTDSDGLQKTPVVIHRALYGSIERFLGVLIEHFEAKFPFWLSPLQIGIVPVYESHNDYAEEILKKLKEKGFRATLNKSDGTMGNKIKEYRNELAPYILILGDKEKESETISLRTRDGVQINDIKLESFIKACEVMQNEHNLKLVEEF